MIKKSGKQGRTTEEKDDAVHETSEELNRVNHAAVEINYSKATPIETVPEDENLDEIVSVDQADDECSAEDEITDAEKRRLEKLRLQDEKML